MEICKYNKEYLGVKYCIKKDEACLIENTNLKEIQYTHVYLPYNKKEILMLCDGIKNGK